MRCVDDAQAAVSAGADAVGLIFYAPSSRHLSLPQAAEICRAVPPFVATVAVMVNPSAEEVQAILRAVNPAYLQFHGEESAAFCDGFGKPYIKTLRVAEDADWRAEATAMATQYPSADAILLDTHSREKYGGTGATFNWGNGRYNGEKPIILAGGLHTENVTEAVQRVAPFAVDVSSGVESDGRKDPVKINAFCKKVYEAR